MTGVADIPSATDRRWHELLSGQRAPAYRCLALRILMIRLTHAYKRPDGEPAAVIEELRGFFRDNMRFAADDFRTLFEGAAR